MARTRQVPPSPIPFHVVNDLHAEAVRARRAFRPTPPSSKSGKTPSFVSIKPQWYDPELSPLHTAYRRLYELVEAAQQLELFPPAAMAVMVKSVASTYWAREEGDKAEFERVRETVVARFESRVASLRANLGRLEEGMEVLKGVPFEGSAVAVELPPFENRGRGGLGGLGPAPADGVNKPSHGKASNEGVHTNEHLHISTVEQSPPKQSTETSSEQPEQLHATLIASTRPSKNKKRTRPNDLDSSDNNRGQGEEKDCDTNNTSTVPSKSKKRTRPADLDDSDMSAGHVEEQDGDGGAAPKRPKLTPYPQPPYNTSTNGPSPDLYHHRSALHTARTFAEVRYPVGPTHWSDPATVRAYNITPHGNGVRGGRAPKRAALARMKVRRVVPGKKVASPLVGMPRPCVGSALGFPVWVGVEGGVEEVRELEAEVGREVEWETEREAEGTAMPGAWPDKDVVMPGEGWKGYGGSCVVT